MDNRKKIQAAALDLFYAKGYDAVGIQEIVDAAGVTKPTLYYHFGSKRGLLEELLQESYLQLEQAMEKAVVYDGSFPDILFRVAKSFLGFACENRKSYRFTLSLFYAGKENEGHRIVEPLINRYYARIVSLFETAARELGNMNGRQQQFALGFLGLLDSKFLEKDNRIPEGVKTEVPDEEIRGIVQQFMYGIYS